MDLGPGCPLGWGHGSRLLPTGRPVGNVGLGGLEKVAVVI
jgi:hypothetical protein